MRIMLLLFILILLAGCGAAAVGTEATTTGGQPAATTEIELPTRTSQPTVTPEPVATSSQPETTPEQPTSASQPETTPESPSSDDVVAVWTRSGGFAGLHEVLTVFADGRLSLEKKVVTTNGQADPTDFERLRQTLGSPDWQQLAKRYGVQHPDAFQYTIQAKDKTVETFDGSDNPQVLTELLGQFQTLYQSVVPAPGAGGAE